MYTFYSDDADKLISGPYYATFTSGQTASLTVWDGFGSYSIVNIATATVIPRPSASGSAASVAATGSGAGVAASAGSASGSGGASASGVRFFYFVPADQATDVWFTVGPICFVN
jgi:hypothetical protein